MTDISQTVWIWIILIYYILATLLPIDKIIGRFYPIFGIALFAISLSILLVLIFGDYNIPNLNAESWVNMKSDSERFPIMPTLFITIACGAVSGFHATQSPLMVRCINNQREGRPVFFGAMISESIYSTDLGSSGHGLLGRSRGVKFNTR